MFVNGQGRIRRIKEELLDYINLLIVESDDNHRNQYLTKALECVKTLKEMNGINHIINLDGGITFLDLIYIYDSQNKKRLNNPDLLLLEKAIKEAGGEGQELIMNNLNKFEREVIEYSDQHKKSVHKLKSDIKNLVNSPLHRSFLKESLLHIINEGETFLLKKEENWNCFTKKYSIPYEEIQKITEVSEKIEHELFILKNSVIGLYIIRKQLNISPPSYKLTNLATHRDKRNCDIT